MIAGFFLLCKGINITASELLYLQINILLLNKKSVYLSGKKRANYNGDTYTN